MCDEWTQLTDQWCATVRGDQFKKEEGEREREDKQTPGSSGSLWLLAGGCLLLQVVHVSVYQ